MKALSLERLHAEAAGTDTLLDSIGRDNWTPAMIEAHKAHEMAKAPQASRLWPYLSWFRRLETSLILMLSVAWTLVCIGALGSLLSYLVSKLPTTMHLPRLPGVDVISWISHDLLMIGGVMFMVAAAAVTVMILFGNIKVFGPARWEIRVVDNFMWLADYPDRAVRMIREARLLLPYATIRIHTLKQDSATLDPILEIDGHYVLVWDGDGKIIPPPS